MQIDQKQLEELLGTVCDQIRQSPLQTREAIIQQSRQRLGFDSNDRGAVNVLAAAALLRNRPERTLALLESDIQRLHADPMGSRLAGYAWMLNQDVQNAYRAFDRSVRLNPCQPDCWTQLGRIAEHCGETDGALAYYERASFFDDGRYGSALALSKLLSRNSKLEDAIHALRLSLMKNKRCSKMNTALARLLCRRARIMGRRRKPLLQRKLRNEALDCYAIANASNPRSMTLLAQGLLQQQLGRFDDAKASFQKAVDINPRHAAAICHLAAANVDSGDIDLAIGQFEQALSLNPELAGAHFRYARAKKFRLGKQTDAYVAQLEQQIAIPDQPDRNRIYLHFAIGKVLEDIGRFDEAWEHYDLANRLKPGHSQSLSTRPVVNPQPPLKRFADKSIAFYSKQRIARRCRWGNPSRKPVFIVGMPRSGTTLTEQILSSHPEVAGGGELRDIDQIRFQLQRQYGRVGEKHGDIAPSASYPQLLESISAGELGRFADGYLDRLDSIGGGASRVTDKMPTNFMHLGLIASMFPNATIIHCRRNPMDVFVSSFCQNLSAPFCDLEQLVVYHRQYRRLMSHWESVLPMRIHTVDYESLVSDPEPQTRALIEHCQLSWDESCLNFHTNRRAVHTPSKWQVRQKMYTTSVEKWRRFENHLGSIAAQVAEEIEAESRRKRVA